MGGMPSLTHWLRAIQVASDGSWLRRSPLPRQAPKRLIASACEVLNTRLTALE
jgi:hypothetical protein